MSREIKFRVWNKDDSTMYQPHSFIEGYQERNDIELMQFTGLKDKNGKEIYEGDVVKHERQVSEVKYNQELAIFEANAIPLFLEGVEVIGNIYEDKHLFRLR